MVNGSTLIFDMNVGIEKYFLENHGGPVTSIDFFKDNAVMTGSAYGSVYIHELKENQENQAYFMLKRQNVMDQNIPIAKVVCSSYGIAAALDVKGNL